MVTSSLLFALADSFLLLCVILRASSGFPVSADHHAHCGPLFRSLLQNVPGLFNSPILCYGVLSDKVAVSTRTETTRACAPNPTQNSGCVRQRNSSFSESECLRNIMKDLAHYHTAITFYVQLESKLKFPEKETALLKPTLEIIHNLRKSCSHEPTKDDSAEETADKMWGSDSFANRLKMCQLMRGFHIRAITMNRAIRYMSSGDHRN